MLHIPVLCLKKLVFVLTALLALSFFPAKVYSQTVGDDIVNPVTGATETISALLADTGQAETEEGNVIFLDTTIGATFTDSGGTVFIVTANVSRDYLDEARVTQVEISDGTTTRLVETVAFDPERSGLYVNPFSADVETVVSVNNATLLTEDGDILRYETDVGALYRIGDTDFEIIARDLDAQGRVVGLILSDTDPNATEIVTLDRLQDRPVLDEFIINPATSEPERIVDLEGSNSVETFEGNVFVFNTNIGDAYIADGEEEGEDSLLFISGQDFDTDGALTNVTLTDYADMPFEGMVDVADFNDDDGSGDIDGDPETRVDLPLPTGNINTVAVSVTGADGADGRDGFGAEVQVPYLACTRTANVLGIRICTAFEARTRAVTVGRAARPGVDGSIPATQTVLITPTDNGDIQSIDEQAPGVSVISIGGDGGDGGDAFGALPAREGGDGGDGGVVEITNQVDITTSGTRSHGIYGRSGAGQAGEGGTGIGASPAGAGGDGGTGGRVEITNDTDGRIITFGDDAAGILAMSTGGSGESDGDSFGIVGIAASGGSSGGDGGTTIVTNRGYIETNGQSANGLMAQSLGGDGGDAGTTVGIISVGNTSPDAGGGSGGTVMVTNSGTVRTNGDNANGVLAQSIGGGGGSGGISAGLVAVGSAGSAGGSGGTVTVTNESEGAIVTTGQGSHGIKAQSIGGGGGTGGTTGAGAVAVGSSGGAGSDGETVVVENAGLIRTENSADAPRQTYGVSANPFLPIDIENTDAFDLSTQASQGIIAQSIGGGGGTAEGAGAALVTVGGRGSAGGDGGMVTVTNTGTIQTGSVGGDAITAQSIGGGGGSGALTIGLVAVGGRGDAAGNGAAVTVDNSGVVETTNNLARGILAQSIGGGGGSGGIAGGAVSIGGSSNTDGGGGEVIVTNSGRISTLGAHSTGVLAQSIGGGGGSGGSSAGIIAVGGEASAGGDAGDVTVNNSGTIETNDYAASAIVAQSIGGGGGDGGHAYSGGAFGSVAVGARGQAGGMAGNVTVALSDTPTQDALISTNGAASHGIYAQAIGGGGGTGGDSVSSSLGAFGAVSVSIGGAGGSGNDGGQVMVEGTGTIMTQGQGSTGITALSIGGGGGSGGASIALSAAAGPVSGSVTTSVGGSGSNGGNANAVTINAGGAISTTGNNARALHAQSIGGGGGTGNIAIGGSLSAAPGGAISAGVTVGGAGDAGGDGHEVNATYDGNVQTSGENSDAIVLQSIGGGGGIGGMSVDSRLSASTGVAISAGTGVGGSGSGGGDGGVIMANVNGTVVTTGEASSAIIAESIGGGGGEGGLTIASGVAVGTTAGAAVASVGGTGGGGGDGREVTIEATDLTIVTQGAGAHGLQASSIGGGGGRGGYSILNSLTISGTAGANLRSGVGGSGDGGGDGGTVTLDVAGDIDVAAGNYALDVKSVGGGGGEGAYSISSGLSFAATGTANVGFGLGGSGGDGGNGGSIDAEFRGDLGGEALFQSVGGGGGTGGFNISGGLAASTNSGNINVGIGGSGGAGGFSQAVSAIMLGDITTQDTALLAQSLGGGGGAGAFNISGGLSFGLAATGNVTVGIGGSGGNGGNAGAVDLLRNGAVGYARGTGTIVGAESVGGGGGSGAFNISGGVTISTANSANLNFGLGGSGGAGGTGAAVDLLSLGDVTQGVGRVETYTLADFLAGHAALETSDRTVAVIAKSVGGGGGTGDFNITGGIAAVGGPSGSPNINLGIGGAGGDGNFAGDVTLFVADEDASCTNIDCTVVAPQTAVITAAGTDAIGVAAQSIGGGGGNGSFNVAGGITTGSAISLGIGGSGGDSGAGGAVTADVFADVYVLGENATGILAESVGGGGGSGGFNVAGGIVANVGSGANLSLGIGGDAGDANISGSVTLNQDGDVTALGENASGVVAQSLAGSGGSGGFNVSGVVALLSDNPTITVGIGGSGGDAAEANGVNVFSDGNMLVGELDPIAPPPTGGDTPDLMGPAGDVSASVGLLAQSIGGGGGNAGFNLDLALSTTAPVVSSNITIGGVGGDAAHAGAVDVRRGQTAAGEMIVNGDGAAGILAQSIGGGGGNAGVNFGGSVQTGVSLSNNIAVGGGGGTAGNGNTVDVLHDGSITTSGQTAYGIVAQSVGGGGGNAAVNLIASATNSDVSSLNVTVGGQPGEGGNGQAVTLTHTGAVTTTGQSANAILAQSLGGGGGNADLSTTFNPLGGSELSVGLGRLGGTGGSADIVTVISNGVLATSGNDASAIVAQSIGNGGGASGSMDVGAGLRDSVAVSASVGLEGGSGGFAEQVTVTASGAITTGGSNSHAVHAQSVGGGGGIGGIAMSTSFQDDASAVVNVGGVGGTGAVSGVVDITTSADILTLGSSSHGVYAQSIGGAGGVGGAAAELAFNATSSGTANASVNLGGIGGMGADARAVDVRNDGTITTQAESSNGIHAQSVGGGGGTGGATARLDLTFSTASSSSIGLSMGGFGGMGGVGEAVTVENTNAIATQSDDSYGIFAQSVGGGGGNGGMVGELDSQFGGYNASLAVNLGGDGGSGGTGGSVDVTNFAGGQITTLGNGSHGILAQSVGGGGGDGGAVLSARSSLGLDISGQVALGFNMGGVGGTANTASDVTVTNAGGIETQGDNAHGIFAQSIGGGGGTGGFAGAAQLSTNIFTSANSAFALGGSGGDGGNGDDVTVTNTGSITTTGAGAHGIKAQSVGGGGGDANLGLSASSLNTTIMANALSFAIGSTGGGGGGTGGDVVVNQFGTISISGDNTEAVVAESINGGGGGLVMDFGTVTSLTSLASLQFPTPDGSGSVADYGTTEEETQIRLSSGAQGVSDAEAGNVTVNVAGDVMSSGNGAAVMRQQSIGGGGGTQVISMTLAQAEGFTADALEFDATLGGADGINNSGQAVSLAYQGALQADGEGRIGSLAQSIGGGGGLTDIDITAIDAPMGVARFALGSQRGTGESGGVVGLLRGGDTQMSGALSFGMLAQSIGGGGGVLTYTVTEDAAPAADPALAAQERVAIQMGSAGTTGANGSAVGLVRDGDLTVTGQNAFGIVLQSIGGGGGAVVSDTGNRALDITLGGTEGAEGNGGTITMQSMGTITTLGSNSQAVLAQSIGGGGGLVTHNSDPAQLMVNTSADNSGDGGAIDLTVGGAIEVMGANSFGILAQSIGGGGGFVEQFGTVHAGGAGDGGDVSLLVAGSVAAMAEGSTAVQLQSLGESNGELSLSIGLGQSVGAVAGSTAVSLLGGALNQITNQGMIFAEAADDTIAIRTDGSGVDIENTGIVHGNVVLSEGSTGQFRNLGAGAILQTNTMVDLGLSTNMLVNDGTLVIGGTGVQGTVTALNGSLESTDNAVLAIDLTYQNGLVDLTLLDQMQVSGTAQMGGLVDVDVANLGHIAPGMRELVFLSTDGTPMTGAFDLDAPNTVVAQYALAYPTESTAALRVAVDFAPDGLGPKGLAFGEYINRLQSSGRADATGDFVAGLASVTEFEELRETYAAFDGAVYGQNLASTSTQAMQFTQAMMSCPDRGNTTTSLQEAECMWLEPYLSYTQTDANGIFDEGEDRSGGLTGGLQRQLQSGDFFGLGVSFGQSTSSIGDTAEATGRQFRLAASYKRIFDNDTKVSLVFGGGRDRYSNTRMGVVFGAPALFESDQTVDYLTLAARYQLQIDRASMTFIPEVGFSGLAYDMSSFDETTTAPAALAVDDQTGFDFALNAGFAVAPDTIETDFGALNTAFKFGLNYYVSDPSVSAGLVGAPSGIEGFENEGNRDRLSLRAGAEIDFSTSETSNLSLSTFGEFSEHSRSFGGELKMSVSF